MRKLIWIFILIATVVNAQQDRDIEYIKKHALLAVQEMELYKIPASITLAQGILETGGGQSRLAEQANNHFGIKCKKEWEGGTIYHDDDALGECFRKYNSVKDSYRDHSKFLAERPYYKRLFELDMRDYKGWAHGLKKAGYATNPRYAYILIDKIEKYNLQEFDKINESQVYGKLITLYGGADKKYAQPEQEKVYVAKADIKEEAMQEIKPVQEVAKPKIIRRVEVNKTEHPKEAEVVVKEKHRTRRMTVPTREMSPRARLKRHPIGREYIEVLPGETLNKISKMYDISVEKLMKYNDLEKAEDLRANQILFFYKKKNRGASKYYTVEKGDDMYLISQKVGMKLEKLYCRNRVEEGYEPKVGEVLYLRGKKPRN